MLRIVELKYIWYIIIFIKNIYNTYHHTATNLSCFCCYIAMFAKIWKWVCWISIINGVEQIQHTYYCIMSLLFSTHCRNNMTLATWDSILFLDSFSYSDWCIYINRFNTVIQYCSKLWSDTVLIFKIQYTATKTYEQFY